MPAVGGTNLDGGSVEMVQRIRDGLRALSAEHGRIMQSQAAILSKLEDIVSDLSSYGREVGMLSLLAVIAVVIFLAVIMLVIWWAWRAVRTRRKRRRSMPTASRTPEFSDRASEEEVSRPIIRSSWANPDYRPSAPVIEEKPSAVVPQTYTAHR